jgi:hypothetical protein
VVAVSLTDDRRGRVPFALVGILLLVSASAYTTGLAGQTEPTVDRAVADRLDATSRDVRPALREAIHGAARDAARNPVTEPADTPVGNVLNESSPFVDSLRVRIAVGARAALEGVGRETENGRTTVSLPPIENATDLRRAKRAVRVERVDDGNAMQVTLRNVSLRAHRDGRVVAERRLHVTLTVRTPVLALHGRAKRYERRLNRDPLEGAGLGRGLTARLYPVTIARGLARYGGAPIENVLGNRHVALSTNAALLAQQRAVFGRHDPDAARALEVATLRVGVTDVLRPRNGDAAGFAAAVLRPNAIDDAEQASGRFEPEMPDAPPLSTSPTATADEAYLGVSEDLAAVTAGSYRVEGTLHARVVEQQKRSEPLPDPPGENWTLLTEHTTERTVVSGPGNPATDWVGSRRNGTRDLHRRVTVHHTTTRVWVRGADSRRTTVDWRDEYRVAVSVRASYAPDDAAPNRPTSPVFGPGGALDGPNLAGSREHVARKLVAANGGVDAVAARAATGETAVWSRNVTLTAHRPDSLHPWVASDLRAVRQRVANVTVNISRKRVAAGAANAPARLADELRNRREELVDAPAEYDGVADRARVAARAAYLDRVIAALERRAAETQHRNTAYVEKVMDGSARRLTSLVAIGSRETDRVARQQGPERTGGSASLRVVPDASPAYLTLEAVDRSHVPTVPPNETVHPLAVESTNWFAVPYGEAASEVTGALFDQSRVTLETAAGTLVAANRTLEESGRATDNSTAERRATLEQNRDALAEAVSRSVTRLEGVVCEAADRERTVSARTCRDAVDDLRGRWGAVGRRALAMSNGSYADAFARALEDRGVKPSTAADAAVRVRVRLREATAERRVSVPEETTNRTAAGVRAYARERTTKAVEGAMANATRKAARKVTGASRLPAGLPLAPPPYTWVATVNAWSVTVRGEYQRFALRAPSGGPDGGGAVVRYVRDGATVRLDVDGDGDPERLGRNERISFETGTTVVAAVPPGPPGIGDVDGARTEQSPGWPCPGAAGEGEHRLEEPCPARDAE